MKKKWVEPTIEELTAENTFGCPLPINLNGEPQVENNENAWVGETPPQS